MKGVVAAFAGQCVPRRRTESVRARWSYSEISFRFIGKLLSSNVSLSTLWIESLFFLGTESNLSRGRPLQIERGLQSRLYGIRGEPTYEQLCCLMDGPELGPEGSIGGVGGFVDAANDVDVLE